MIGTHKHWHEIADFFRAVHHHGRRIVAWDRAANVRKSISKEIKAASPGRLDRTATAFFMPVSYAAPEVEQSDDAHVLEEHPNGIDLVEVRNDIRTRLKDLKRSLAASLSEREVHHVLFPMVIFSDEFFLKTTVGRTNIWEPLQSELYEVENGGEMFYEKLDALVIKDDTHPFILEVYYFCLSDGFAGKHEDDRARIEQIKGEIAKRIPVPKVSELSTPNAILPVVLFPFPWKVYVGAALAALLCFVICTGIGIAEHDRHYLKFSHSEDADEPGGR